MSLKAVYCFFLTFSSLYIAKVKPASMRGNGKYYLISLKDKVNNISRENFKNMADYMNDVVPGILQDHPLDVTLGLNFNTG